MKRDEGPVGAKRIAQERHGKLLEGLRGEATMNSERNSYCGGADDDAEMTLVERLQEAFFDENLEECCDCIDRLQQAAAEGKDTGDAWIKFLKQFQTLFDFHEAEYRARAEQDPEACEIMLRFCDLLRRVFPKKNDHEDEE
jgi:hypothetical protein